MTFKKCAFVIIDDFTVDNLVDDFTVDNLGDDMPSSVV